MRRERDHPIVGGGRLRIEANFYSDGGAIRAAKPRFDREQKRAQITNRTGVESFIWSEKGYISATQTSSGDWNVQVRALDVNLDLTVAISGVPGGRHQLTDLAEQIAKAYLDGPMPIE